MQRSSVASILNTRRDWTFYFKKVAQTEKTQWGKEADSVLQKKEIVQIKTKSMKAKLNLTNEKP